MITSLIIMGAAIASAMLFTFGFFLGWRRGCDCCRQNKNHCPM